MNNFIGKKVIIRGDRSGVFFGTLAAKDCHICEFFIRQFYVQRYNYTQCR